MFKAYIFDLDGTILDSMHVWLQIDIDFLNKRGFEVPAAYVENVSAMHFPEAAAYTKEAFNLPDSIESIMQEWNDMAIHEYSNTVHMKPGVKKYLMDLRIRGIKLAVATSSVPELYKPALSNHEVLDWFDVICISEEVGYGKSRPDIFALTAKKLGVLPQECVVFEDIIEAVKSAKSIGMTVCGVYDESSAKDWEEIKKIADFSIENFEELGELQ